MNETERATGSPVEKEAGKSPLRSKTVWVNVVMVLSTFLPAVGEWLAENPVSFVAALGSLNILVRFVTQGKVSILGKIGAASPVLLFGLSGLAALSLPSCADYGLRGSASFRHEETGAKGGLSFEPGRMWRPWLRVPIVTDEGRGFVEIVGEK